LLVVLLPLLLIAGEKLTRPLRRRHSGTAKPDDSTTSRLYALITTGIHHDRDHLVVMPPVGARLDAAPNGLDSPLD